MTPVIEFRVHRFHPKGLDPVTVYVEQYGPASSRITVQCYARAWTAYWGSHGARGVEAFVTNCGAEYIADNLVWGTNGLFTKHAEKLDRAYLLRIAQALKDHFSSLKGGEA